jgi:phospholipid/cholesterol/gamma-HCH transport system substrate-binding protein
METKANYVLVGIFTLIAIVAAFGFVYWTATVGDRGETAPLRVRIPGSASGLARGSAVLFNGVRVGDVRRVYLDVNDPTIAIADTEIDRLTPLTKSTQADIGIAGLTGQANIELRGANLKEPKLLDQAEQTGKVAEITANPSAVTNLLETAQDIFKRADSVLDNLQGFVTDVRGPLTETVKNAQKFSEALGNNADGVDDFLASVTKLSQQLAGASDKLDSTLDAAEGLLKSVDKEKVAKIVDNVEKVSGNLSATSDRIDGVVARVDGAVKSITEFSDGARQTLAKVDDILKGVDPETLRTTIANIDSTFDAAEGLLKSVDKEKVAQIVDNVEKLSGNLSATSDQIDGVVARVDGAVKSITEFSDGARGTLAKVDDILGGVDAKTLRETIENIESASKNAKQVVEDVSKVTTKIGARADDIDQIIADAHELADRLNQASTRVDGILVKVDSLLGSDDAKGLAVEASETLKSFKQVADTLNSRLGTITEGLARFSNQGLRDVEALVRDSRRSINRIEEAVSDLERNPQRIITGGDGQVRQYDGRARR